MQRAKPVADLVVSTIDCECILDQIVCPELKKINLSSDLLRSQYSRRNFDHRADLHGGEWNVLVRESLNLFFNYTLRKSNVRHVRHHRNHETERSSRSRTQN